MSKNTGLCITYDDDSLVELAEVVAQGSFERRRLTSKVWNDFDKLKGPKGEIARCKHCKKNFVGGSGTSNLRKHLDGRCPVLLQQEAEHADTDATTNVIYASPESAFKLDQEKSQKDFARMIIKHNYPFNMAEHDLFETFCNNLQPMFKFVLRNTVRDDVIDIYHEEKNKLYKILDDLSCRIALTADIWTSEHQNFAYICMCAHYITDDWLLKKNILAYKYILYPHDGTALFGWIEELILEWNIDKKLFSIVVDDATNNDVMVRLLGDRLSEKKLLPLDGKLFHARCSAHMLNMAVQDGLKMIEGLVGKIRDTVKYLDESPLAKQKFDLALNQVKLQGRKIVPIDVPTSWNSTYEMVEAAVDLEKAFCRMEEIDKNYKYNLSLEEWKLAKMVNDCLKMLFDATVHFSGSSFPTLNVLFPDICMIQLKLKEWENSKYELLRLMVVPMRMKFKKYWEECSLVLAIAVVLDPRFKLQVVEYYYGRIYGEEAPMHVKRVRSAFTDLFYEYQGESSCSRTPFGSIAVGSGGSQVPCNSSNLEESHSEFFQWYESTCASDQKSQLEQYLEEPLFPSSADFSILNWWKINSTRLPTLAKIARDILAIPATTVALEAAFSLGGRVLDETGSSLPPDVVEALVTANDWIQW
ncbi:hypothetical protein NMG60_11035280 [Bertholletia excelsa]